MHRIILTLLATTIATPVLANASIAEFAAGGVVFKEAANIAIEREHLSIGLQDVQVHYDYRSDATTTQHVTIGFPMPPVPMDGSPDDPRQFIDEGSDVLNYMLFTASVNGVPVETTLHQYAWVGDKNVTSELLELGLPIYLPYEEAETVLGALTPEAIDDLVERGLVIRYDEYVAPVWQYQTVYEWSQDFVPGTTKVDIAYRPLAGFPSDIGDHYEADPDGQYCVDDRLRKTIADWKKKGAYYQVGTVGYIMTTAAYWKGPIGQFNLTIVKDKPVVEYSQVASETAFCGRAESTETKDAFNWTKTDFVPERDISVVSYSIYDYGE